jgi:hypothetical protein
MTGLIVKTVVLDGGAGRDRTWEMPSAKERFERIDALGNQRPACR